MDDVWPDHAVLQGVFAKLTKAIPRHIWPVPAEFHWPSDWDVSSDVWQRTIGTVDERYEAVWKHVETSAIAVLPFAVPKSCLGRASTLTTKAIVTDKVAPVKRGRPNDFNPQFLCASFRHAQWIRQVRRLQSFAHFASGSSYSPGHPHALAVWGSIVRAKGFVPSFSQWWLTCKFRVHGSPAQVPMYPPDASLAVCMFESVALAVRDLEGQLKKSSRAYAKLRRENNPNMIFQDIKSHPEKGVDLLVRPVEAVVARSQGR